MWTMLQLGLFIGLGYGIWLAGQWLVQLYEERVSDDARDCLYRTTRKLPQLIVDSAFAALFLLSLGATILHWLVRPLIGEEFMPDTSWAPSVFAFFAMIFAVSFWSSPEKPKAPPQVRGRELKKSVPGSLESRGRTIRYYRDLE
jgi:hypothetical protein